MFALSYSYMGGLNPPPPKPALTTIKEEGLLTLSLKKVLCDNVILDSIWGGGFWFKVSSFVAC